MMANLRLVCFSLMLVCFAACTRGRPEMTLSGRSWSGHRVVAVRGPGGGLEFQLARPGELLQLAWGHGTIRWRYELGGSVRWQQKGRRILRAGDWVGIDLRALPAPRVLLRLRGSPRSGSADHDRALDARRGNRNRQLFFF